MQGRARGTGMRRVFSICTTVSLITLLLACDAARAIMPPRPGTGARPPDPGEMLRRAGYGRPGVPDRYPSVNRSDPDRMTGKAAAFVGQARLPVLLGDMADLPGTQDPATLQAELFGQWPSGSLASYFAQASYGAFTVTGEVRGWFRLPQSSSQYEGGYWPAGPGGLVHDLVAAADAAGQDWGPYDNDGPDGVPNSGDDDGYVDTVVLVHAGAGGECGSGGAIWSHTFFLRGWGAEAFVTSTPAAGGGFLLVDDYTLQPELSCDGGLIEIGVFCHEYGHALGLPDLYDTRTGAGSGVGNWGLMGTGSWGGDGQSPRRPVHPCAWSKVDLGWVTPLVVEEDGDYELGASELVPTVLQIWSGGQPGREYFLVENRHRTLNDAALPASGLNIWHVDEDEVDDGRVDNTVNSRPIYGVALEQSDGLDHLGAGQNRGDAADPFPGLGPLTAFSNDTTPSSRANGEVSTDVSLTGISAPGETMFLGVDIGVPELDRTPPAVAVTSPAGGEDWQAGNQYSVTWSATDEVGVAGVGIRLSRDGGVSFPDILAADLANSGVWRWSTPLETGGDYRIKVVAADHRGNEGWAVSAAPFTLSDAFPPGVVVLDPSAGEEWMAGDTGHVAWQAADNIGVAAVDIRLSVDGGATWSVLIAENLSNGGSYDWSVAPFHTVQAVVRVEARDAAGLVGWQQSEPFTLTSAAGVGDAPSAMQLGPCVPNPFNPAAVIHFVAAEEGRVRVTVFDLAGRRVKTLLDEYRPPGPGSVRWQGRDERGRAVASGVYYVQAQAGGQRRLIKTTLVR